MLPTERLYYYKNTKCIMFSLSGGMLSSAPSHHSNFSYPPPLPMKQPSGLPKPVTSTPAFRRRRTIWFLLACIICSIIFFSSSISLPRSNLFGSSSAEPNPLLRDALELHGLQHFVLNSGSSLHKVLYKANRDRPQGVLVHDHARNGDNENRDDGVPDPEHERLDPTKDIDLKVYSSFDGDDDWVKHVRELQTNSPLVVFSKVRAFSNVVFSSYLNSGCMVTGCTPPSSRSVFSYGQCFCRPPPPRFIFMFTSSEEREADCYWPFSHMSPPLGPSLHNMYGTSKVVLPILKARQKPHPDLRSRPPSEDS